MLSTDTIWDKLLEVKGSARSNAGRGRAERVVGVALPDCGAAAFGAEQRGMSRYLSY